MSSCIRLWPIRLLVLDPHQWSSCNSNFRIFDLCSQILWPCFKKIRRPRSFFCRYMFVWMYYADWSNNWSMFESCCWALPELLSIWSGQEPTRHGICKSKFYVDIHLGALSWGNFRWSFRGYERKNTSPLWAVRRLLIKVNRRKSQLNHKDRLIIKSLKLILYPLR